MVESRRPSVDSVVSSASHARSRTWGDDIQKHWNLPVSPAETFQQRILRYEEYFKLNTPQLLRIHGTMLEDMREFAGPQVDLSNSCSVKMLDTCISQLPTGQEKGTAYALDFSGTVVRAAKVRLEGNGRISTIEHHTNIREQRTVPFSKGLLDKECGAMELFDFLASCLKELMEKTSDLGKNKATVSVAFSLSFPCQPRGLESSSLLHWTKGFETGRETADPVEGQDLRILLDMAFWRAEVNAKTVLVTNGAAATLVACEYEKPRKLPACVVSFLCGVGVNGVYSEANAINLGYRGHLINTEIGSFDKGLPVTDVDLEVDFADCGGHGQQMLEKMTGGGYLGELCRRLTIKVFQSEAPSLAWSRQSLPTAAAALCVADTSNDLGMISRLLSGLWEWETTQEVRETVRNLFAMVFDRSAALAACCIAALAKNSGRLQPAMGGVTCAVDATFHASHTWYTDSVRSHLKEILGSTAQFVNLFVTHDGAAKGAAVLAILDCGK